MLVNFLLVYCVYSAELLIDTRWIPKKCTRAVENLFPLIQLLVLKVWFLVYYKITVFALWNHEGFSANGFIISVSGTIQSN